MALQFTKISSNTRLMPGERIKIELRQRVSFGDTIDGYIMASRIHSIEQNYPEFTVESWDYVDGGLDLHIIINDAATDTRLMLAGVVTPGVIIGLVMGVAAIAVSATTWRVTDAVERIADSPAGQAALATTPVIMLLIALIVGLILWKTIGK